VGEMIREVCIISIVCALACHLSPEGQVKKIMSMCCCVIMMLLVLSPLGEFDMGKYADFLAKYRELEVEMNNNVRGTQAKLDRLVIEQEYRTYIMDKAKEKGVDIVDASIALAWNTEGYWVPWEIRLNSCEGERVRDIFTSFLTMELGVSEEKIIWMSPE